MDTDRKYFELVREKNYFCLCPSFHFLFRSVHGILATDMAITIDGNDDEETNIMDHLAASQTPAPRSTVGGLLLSTPVPAVANASTAGAGSKQSSLATFFMKSSEKVSCLLQQVFLD